VLRVAHELLFGVLYELGMVALQPFIKDYDQSVLEVCTSVMTSRTPIFSVLRIALRYSYQIQETSLLFYMKLSHTEYYISLVQYFK